MRVHINLDDDLLAAVDQFAGPRGRTAFIEQALRTALDHERRWAAIEAGIGSIPDTGHDWDEDPAEWVRAQRFEDPARVG
jgi:predicted transcriptional regulator